VLGGVGFGRLAGSSLPVFPAVVGPHFLVGLFAVVSAGFVGCVVGHVPDIFLVALGFSVLFS
jgi:hypothetical protein